MLKYLVNLIVAFPSPIILVKRFPTLSLMRYLTPALFDRLESIRNTWSENDARKEKGAPIINYLLPTLCEWFPPNGKLAFASLPILLHPLCRQLPVHNVHFGVYPHCSAGKESPD